MKENEILDAPDFSRPLKNIWLIRFITLALLILLFILIDRVSMFTHALPPFISFIRDSIFQIPLIGCLYFFIKNINYQSIQLLWICIQSSVLIFIAFIGSRFILLLINPLSFLTVDYLGLFLASSLVGCIFSFAIYYKLTHKNHWLLPLFYSLEIGLLALANFL